MDSKCVTNQTMYDYLSSFIYDVDTSASISMEQYLKYDMKKKVMMNIKLRGYDDSYKFESYKIMPRAQNAHALVNAAFLFKLNKNNVVESARMVYGAISPAFVRATKTEAYLKGKIRNLY